MCRDGQTYTRCRGIRTFAAMLMGAIRKAYHELDTDYVRVW